MGQDSFIPVAANARSRSDLIERGFSRQPLKVDVDIARSLEALSHAAWSVPKDKYYDEGDRYRALNRVRAEIVEGGVTDNDKQEMDRFTMRESGECYVFDDDRQRPEGWISCPPRIYVVLGRFSLLGRNRATKLFKILNTSS